MANGTTNLQDPPAVGTPTAPGVAATGTAGRPSAVGGPTTPASPASPPASAGRPAPVLGYAARRGRAARLWGWVARWAEGALPAKQVAGFSKSLLWVAPLTVLIWVYAERQQQFTEPGQTVPVEVVSGDPNRIALVQRPADGNVVVSLKGPKANIDRLKELLRRPGVPPVQIQAERTGRDGEQTLTIPTSRIGQDKRFVDAGVTIDNPQPESLIVRIEPMVDWDVPIQVPPQQREQFPNVEFTPPTVRVRGPASVVGDRNDGRDLSARVFVYADLSNRPELPADPEQEKFLKDVKVGLAVRNANVTLTLPPAGVAARVRPSGAEDYMIQSLPVKVVPGPAARDFDWTDPLPLYNVTVSGPKEKIQKLKDATAGLPAAFAELPASIPAGAADGSGGATVDATVKYQFEPGITVKAGPPTVPVTLQRKAR